MVMNRRRIFATGFLFLAVAMLVVGETVLKHRLSPVGTLLYWTGCLLATLSAILCALLDLGRSLRASHAERRELVEETVREIQTEHERRQSATHVATKSR